MRLFFPDRDKEQDICKFIAEEKNKNIEGTIYVLFPTVWNIIDD